jgi:hypothetical protein
VSTTAPPATSPITATVATAMIGPWRRRGQAGGAWYHGSPYPGYPGGAPYPGGPGGYPTDGGGGEYAPGGPGLGDG